MIPLACAVMPKARNENPSSLPQARSAAPAERHEKSDSFLIAFSHGVFEDPHFLSYRRKAFF